MRYTDFTEWSETVYAFASMKNASVIADEFSRGPMSEAEVSQIAKSIARWVWGTITPEQTQANRKRWAKSLAEGRKKKMNERLEVLEVMNSERF
nr:primase C-terminal domain-containing protein [Rothia sp. ZJ1223]